MGWFIIFCLALSINAFGQSANTVCQLSGKVTYKGNPVPDACRVIAYIQGVKYAETEVKNGIYSLSIPADDPSTLAKEGWVEGDNVSLKVEGYSGATFSKAAPGSSKVDINLTTMGVLNLTTWGKIKALFK